MICTTNMAIYRESTIIHFFFHIRVITSIGDSITLCKEKDDDACFILSPFSHIHYNFHHNHEQ